MKETWVLRLLFESITTELIFPVVGCPVRVVGLLLKNPFLNQVRHVVSYLPIGQEDVITLSHLEPDVMDRDRHEFPSMALCHI